MPLALSYAVPQQQSCAMLPNILLCALTGNHDSRQSWFKVRTGFKQGDVNARMLFNLFFIQCLQPILRQTGVDFR